MLNKNFSEAEPNFDIVEFALNLHHYVQLRIICINSYSEAFDNLKRYLKKYPGDKNVIYAHYLIAHYEQISDEKDLKPLIDAIKKIDFFLKEYPDSDYAMDLKFKKDLIVNQLVMKELFIAKHYIKKRNGYLQ